MILYGNEILDNYICPLIKDNKIVFKTSGTTGEPKEIAHNLKNFLKRYEENRPGYRTLITLDLSRLGGIDALLHVYFYGGTAIIPDHKDPQNVIELLGTEDVELLITTPTMLRLMLLAGAGNYKYPKLKVIAYGSERMTDSLLYSIAKEFPNVKLKETYGLTEVGTLKTHSNWKLLKILDREWKVVDGILWINNFGEWINTGDRVKELGHGFIEILGRNSSTINTGGYKVQAEEVEEALWEIGVESLVYGEANELLGEIVVADVVANEDFRDFISEFCKNRLDKYKIPMKFNFVNNIEYNSNGKKVRK